MAATLRGRVAIVTGGVSGIGAGIAARLAAEGARVSLWDRDAAALANAEAPHKVTLDVTDAAAVQRAADDTARARQDRHPGRLGRHHRSQSPRCGSTRSPTGTG